MGSCAQCGERLAEPYPNLAGLGATQILGKLAWAPSRYGPMRPMDVAEKYR